MKKKKIDRPVLASTVMTMHQFLIDKFRYVTTTQWLSSWLSGVPSHHFFLLDWQFKLNGPRKNENVLTDKLAKVTPAIFVDIFVLTYSRVY